MNNETSARHPLVLLIDEVVRLKSRLQTVFGDVTAATTLAPTELTVLTAVVEAQAPPTVPQIGRSLGHQRQVIQRATNALLDAGLLETAPNPDHKRAHLLYATRAGRALYEETIARAEKIANELACVVDFAKCEQLVGELKELRGKIEDHLRTREAQCDAPRAQNHPCGWLLENPEKRGAKPR